MLRLYDFAGSANCYKAAVQAWLGRVEATPSFMNDLERYPTDAGPGGRSPHG